MTPKNNRLFGSLTMKLVILALTVLGLGLVGCSEDLPTNTPAGGNDPATGVFRVDVGDDNIDFEIISTKNGDPENPIDGPFAIRGRNIRYDSDMGALIVDLSVKNLGENTFDEVITLTFLSLLPDGVTVLNPDNGENGPGAAIDFEFENDDGQWTPGEESLARETQFSVEEGISIGFVARLDTGTGGGGLGSIGGMVWNDANGDGIMDEDEASIEGATLELAAEGMDAMTTETGADGTYSFDDLSSGFYTVTKMPSEGMVPTTPTMIYVILVLEDGEVISFLAANFGCMEDTGGGSGVISGFVFNDLNGDGSYDDGEPGLEGVEVNLSGDATTTATTAADGTYAFNELMAGSYQIVSVGPDGWTLTTTSPINVMLGTDDEVFDLGIFGWTEGGGGGTAVIKGQVWNDLNGDGNVNDGELGLEGLTVTLSGDATATATTLADGGYAFEGLSAGTYEVVSEGPEGWVLTTTSPIQVVLTTDDEIFNEGSFGWMADSVGGTAAISGIVFNDLNGNRVQDEGEPGIEGISVTLDGSANAIAVSAADGSYSFAELSLGDYKVRSADLEGWSPTTGPELTIKIETEGQVIDDAHLGWMEDVFGTK